MGCGGGVGAGRVPPPPPQVLHGVLRGAQLQRAQPRIRGTAEQRGEWGMGTMGGGTRGGGWGGEQRRGQVRRRSGVPRPALGPGGPGLPPSVGARLPPGRLRPRAAGWGRPAAPDGFWREKRGVETEPRGRSGPGAPNCLRCRGERGTPHVAIRRPLLEAEARRRWARTAALRAVPGGGAWRRHGAAPWGGRCARAGLLRSALLGQTWGSSRRR